jgi:lipoate-protein ligase A
MRLIDSGTLAAQEVMDKDAHLLAELSDEALLHFYQMEGRAATYGLFSKPEELLNVEECLKQQIILAKRPTGGGVIFHFLDLAFSFLIPKSHSLFSENTLQNYQTVNTLVRESLKSMLPEKTFTFLSADQRGRSTFCMAHPTAYDLLCEGKKLVGAAQRKTHKGLLHQGSISILQPPAGALHRLLEAKTADEMLKNSYYLTQDPSELPIIRAKIRSFLLKGFDL